MQLPFKRREIMYSISRNRNSRSNYVNLQVEQYSNEYRKTKTKVIALANHKGQTIQRTNQNSNDRCSQCKALKNLRKQVVIGFGFTSVWLIKWPKCLSQSMSVVMQNQSKRELISTLE